MNFRFVDDRVFLSQSGCPTLFRGFIAKRVGWPTPPFPSRASLALLLPEDHRQPILPANDHYFRIGG